MKGKLHLQRDFKIVQILSFLILALVLAGWADQPPAALASEPAQTPAQEQDTAQPAVLIDPQELELFLDDLVGSTMAEAHVPGAMVAVVQDGRPLLVKGYGYANLETQTAVDPERTLFHVASVSKLFIWTAVMQLVEQGRLSLDDDVNEYLDFIIPPTFPEPVTVRDLMSHTSGFEEKDLGMWRLHADEIMPLGDYLEENMPARIFPPGETVSYSNYGATLAGYIVERVSGLPFSAYAEEHIFAPLGMTHSSFLQPLPSHLAGNLAPGYNYSNGQYLAGAHFNQAYPSSSASATAADMARFMIAHLQEGQLDGRRILKEETAREMHSRLYAPDPRLNGFAHGFFEHEINGQRIISHGGNYISYISNLIMIPEQNLGLFISTNSTTGGDVTTPVVETFLDHYFPEQELPGLQPAGEFTAPIAPYLGQYTPVRSNFTSFEKMNTLFSPIHTSLESDGTLKLSSPGGERFFVEVEPGLLQMVDDPASRLIYRTGSSGQRFLTGNIGMFEPLTLVRTPWYGANSLHLFIFAGASMLFTGALIIWPVASLASSRKRSADDEAHPADGSPPPARLARWTAVLFGLLLLLCGLGFAYIFSDIMPAYGVPSIWFETPPYFNFLLALTYVLAGLALAMAVFAALAWVRSWWSLVGRIFYSLLAIFALLLTWSLVYWNLLL